MLSVIYRFHGHGSLRYVYKHGNAVRSHLVTLKFIRNTRRTQPRCAVVVSKKVHKSAVGRNRIRRRIYEIIREELPYIAAPYDMVFMVFSSEVLQLPPAELKQTICQLLQQANLYK